MRVSMLVFVAASCLWGCAPTSLLSEPCVDGLSAIQEVATWCSVGRDEVSNARAASSLTTYLVCPIATLPFEQGAYHGRLVPAVCALVSDASQPFRVRGHAASAIVNLSDTEGVPDEAVTPYLDTFFSALCSCLNAQNPPALQVRVAFVLFFRASATLAFSKDQRAELVLGLLSRLHF